MTNWQKLFTLSTVYSIIIDHVYYHLLYFHGNLTVREDEKTEKKLGKSTEGGKKV